MIRNPGVSFSRWGVRGVNVHLRWEDNITPREVTFHLSVPQLLRLASGALGVIRSIGKDAFSPADSACSACKQYLLPDEIHYYGNTCEDCERKTNHGP